MSDYAFGQSDIVLEGAATHYDQARRQGLRGPRICRRSLLNRAAYAARSMTTSTPTRRDTPAPYAGLARKK